MGDWQPIETVPKDGTQILGWDGENFSCVEFRTFKDGTASWEIAHNDRGEILSLQSTLTHWMPLPPLPEEE